jgi:hypothetical protein
MTEKKSPTKKGILTASEVLALAKDQPSNLPSISVKRPLDQENDLGNLMGCEGNDLDELSVLLGDDEEAKETAIKDRARDNVQVNKAKITVWKKT